jgi:hypothetical protein
VLSYIVRNKLVLIAIIPLELGSHLAELCKSEYPKFVRICLWILAEVPVIAADIPEGEKRHDTLDFKFSWKRTKLTCPKENVS